MLTNSSLISSGFRTRNLFKKIWVCGWLDVGVLVDRRDICTHETGSSETLRAKIWRRHFALKMVRILLVLVAGKQRTKKLETKSNGLFTVNLRNTSKLGCLKDVKYCIPYFSWFILYLFFSFLTPIVFGCRNVFVFSFHPGGLLQLLKSRRRRMGGGGGLGRGWCSFFHGYYLIISVATVKPKDSCRYCKSAFVSSFIR